MRKILSTVTLLKLAVASTLSLSAISGSRGDQPANPCLFDVCKRQHEANDLGINVQLLVIRRDLKINSPDWMFAEQQPYSDDLNIGYNLKSLINTDAKSDVVIDQINLRILTTQTTQDAQAFSLGVRVGSLITKVTAFLAGKGDLIGIRDESSFVKSWDEEALVINDVLTKLDLESAAVKRDLGTAQEIQATLCDLKVNIDKRWQRDDFRCANLLQQVQRNLRGSIANGRNKAGYKQEILCQFEQTEAGRHPECPKSDIPCEWTGC